jgi:hypothetical protein
MKAFHRILGSWRRASWVAAFAVLSTTAWVIVTHAQSPDADAPQSTTTTTPNALFQYSTITGSGNTITATYLPVVTAKGTTVYKNVALQFDVDSMGNLTLAPGYPIVIPSPTPLISNFRAGNYKGPSNILSGKMLITVAGAGIAPGGATEWTLTTQSSADPCTYPSSATWYVGQFATSPLAGRLTKAGITAADYPDYSWGVGGSQASTICIGSQYYDWQPNTLLAFSQVGGTITILSFTDNGTDYSTSRDQITYTHE